MFYKSTHCTLSGLVARVKLYPPILHDADYSQSESGRKCRTTNNFQKIQIQIPSAGWRDFLAAFPSGSVEEVGLFVVWYLENANIKNSRGKQSAKK